MSINKIISTGAFGAESAALDVAIKLGFKHGGYASDRTGRFGAKVTSRFDLTEEPFESPLGAAKANMNEADGTLFFTQGEPGQDIQHLIEYATEQNHPFWQVDLEQTSPLQAAFQTNIWWTKHSIVTLHVTGSDDQDIYQEVYESLYSTFVLGMEEAAAQDHTAFYRIPIPKTVEEAVRILMDELSLRDKVAIAKMSAEETEDLHFGLGQFIRNRFGFWEGNPRLLLDCAEDAGRDIQHADEASAVIIGRLALELEKTHKLRSV
jgi:hypothetical protein